MTGEPSKEARLFIDCPRCGGSGFTGPETGYDGVCADCGGQKILPTQYKTTLTLNSLVYDLLKTLEHVADSTCINQNGEWVFKQKYDPQTVLDAIDRTIRTIAALPD